MFGPYLQRRKRKLEHRREVLAAAEAETAALREAVAAEAQALTEDMLQVDGGATGRARPAPRRRWWLEKSISEGLRRKSSARLK